MPQSFEGQIRPVIEYPSFGGEDEFRGAWDEESPAWLAPPGNKRALSGRNAARLWPNSA